MRLLRQTLIRLTVFAAASLVTACASAPPPSGDPMAWPVEGAVVTERTLDPAVDRTVAKLASPDFVERSRAAEVLVERGALALPALGAAGEQPVAAPGGAVVSSTRPVVAAILSSAEVRTVNAELASEWPTVRAAAAEELGRRGRWTPIPGLIERLGDTDEDVRSASVSSLRRLTNNFFGYRADATPARRQGAATRWQTWWHQVGRARLERGEAEGPSIASR